MADGQIVITRLPHGNAPQWVRAAWVGCRLPCPSKSYERKQDGSDKPVGMFLMYHVDQEAAHKVLEQMAPAAALWWKSRGYPKQGMYYSFLGSEVKERMPVPLERKQVADDMETGTMELPGR